VIVGSNANNSTNAGSFYLNSNNDSSNANRNIGTRLSVMFVLAQHSLPLGKTCCHRSLVNFIEKLGGTV
jgi:hypothetical protein